MENKLNKDFKRIYTINIIVFIVSQLCISYICFHSEENFFLWLFIAKYVLVIYTISLIASFCIFIATIALGVNIYKSTSKVDIKLKLKVMMFILGTLHFLVLMILGFIILYLIL